MKAQPSYALVMAKDIVTHSSTEREAALVNLIKCTFSGISMGITNYIAKSYNDGYTPSMKNICTFETFKCN